MFGAFVTCNTMLLIPGRCFLGFLKVLFAQLSLVIMSVRPKGTLGHYHEKQMSGTAGVV